MIGKDCAKLEHNYIYIESGISAPISRLSTHTADPRKDRVLAEVERSEKRSALPLPQAGGCLPPQAD